MLAAEIETASEQDGYETVLERWRKGEALLAALVRRRDDLQLALNFAGMPEPGNDHRSAHLYARVAKDVDRARKWPLRVRAELDEANQAIEEQQRIHNETRDDYLAARAERSAEIASQLQPKHLAAIEAIAGALEQLSAALEAEESVRQELTRAAPDPTSALLPDLSSDLRFADLRRWSSPASAWARRVRELGLIE